MESIMENTTENIMEIRIKNRILSANDRIIKKLGGGGITIRAYVPGDTLGKTKEGESFGRAKEGREMETAALGEDCAAVGAVRCYRHESGLRDSVVAAV